VSSETGDQVYTLKGADEPYRVFVEQMQEGAITLDSLGTILYCNRSFSDMLGEPLECVMGKAIGTYFGTESAFDAERIFLAEGSRIETVLISRSRDIPVICSVTRIRIDGPAVFAVTVTDLTTQKDHEADLKRAVTELEGFCYSVSHDLRAPLRSMISAANIVIEDFGSFLPPSGEKELKRLATSASYLGRLIDDLLAYSRLLRNEVARATVDMSNLAQTIAANVEAEANKLVEWQIEPGLEAAGDARLLGMALHNLFSNAVKFSRKGERPKVQFGLDVSNGAFFVRDNGIGFDMQYAHKLFMPFERLHRQEEYPGTGIGLANVKRVVMRHGGQVWTDSALLNGATFFFTLSPESLPNSDK